MIISENIKVKIELPITAEKIEKAFRKKGIKPLRWAIVDIQETTITISVSYNT